MQLHIHSHNAELGYLQKLMKTRDYESIVDLIVKTRSSNLELQNLDWRTRATFKRLIDLFWSEKNRTFTEAVLRWILDHVENDFKSKLFFFATEADLSTLCEEIPAPSSHKPSHGHTDKTCPICTDKMEEGRVITSCLHEFHGECLSRWTEKNGSCPCCRATVSLQPNPFFNAAVKANSPKCAVIIMKKMDVAKTDNFVLNDNIGDESETNSVYPLMYIAAYNNDGGELCKVLLENGMQHLIDTPHGNIFSRTPLGMAIYGSNVNVVQCLVDHGADLQAKVSMPMAGEMSPLQFAQAVKFANKDKTLEPKIDKVIEILLK
jgi:hypothetical protein